LIRLYLTQWTEPSPKHVTTPIQDSGLDLLPAKNFTAAAYYPDVDLDGYPDTQWVLVAVESATAIESDFTPLESLPNTALLDPEDLFKQIKNGRRNSYQNKLNNAGIIVDLSSASTLMDVVTLTIQSWNPTFQGFGQHIEDRASEFA